MQPAMAGNGDISIWIKNSRVGQKTITVNKQTILLLHLWGLVIQLKWFSIILCGVWGESNWHSFIHIHSSWLWWHAHYWWTSEIFTGFWKKETTAVCSPICINTMNTCIYKTTNSICNDLSLESVNIYPISQELTWFWWFRSWSPENSYEIYFK